MIGCGEWKDQLLGFALDASAARGLEQHLQACSACAAALAELRARRERMDAGLRQLVQGAEPSIEFRARVLAAVETQPRQLGLWPAWAGALAAVAALVLFAVLVGPLGPQPDPALMAAQELSRWQSPTETLLLRDWASVLRAITSIILGPGCSCTSVTNCPSSSTGTATP